MKLVYGLCYKSKKLGDLKLLHSTVNTTLNAIIWACLQSALVPSKIFRQALSVLLVQECLKSWTYCKQTKMETRISCLDTLPSKVEVNVLQNFFLAVPSSPSRGNPGKRRQDHLVAGLAGFGYHHHIYSIF